MNIRDNRLKIQRLFDKINHFAKKINQEDTISAIELDILKSHLANLYDVLSTTSSEEVSLPPLAAINENESEAKEEKVEHAPEVNITEKVIIDSGNFGVANENDEVEKVISNVQDFDLSGSVKVEMIEVNLDATPKPKSDIIENKIPKEKNIKEGPTSLNDLFSIVEQKPQPFSSSSTLKTQSNQEGIRTFISINDKLLFISDLFNGDRDAYNNALDKLDTIASPDEAVDFINEEIAPKYDWIDKEQVAEIFFGIVKRKISY